MPYLNHGFTIGKMDLLTEPGNRDSSFLEASHAFSDPQQKKDYLGRWDHTKPESNANWRMPFTARISLFFSVSDGGSPKLVL